jgi:MFS family permease
MNLSTAKSDQDNAPADETASEKGGRSSKRQLPTWAPLRSPLFRAVWLASMASNIGTWMHQVGSAWLMTSLTKDAQMNALVAAAGSLPMFLLSLPAGALGDIIDRRKLIVFTQAWSVVMAGGMALLTLLNMMTPWSVIIFSFLMSLGGAMNGPVMQAVLPEIVKKRQLPTAMSLGGIGWNLSRIIGPLLGGVIISVAAGLLPQKGTAPGVVFALNAISYLAVLMVFARWKRPVRDVDMPPEHMLGAVRAGWRYTQHSPELRAILVRIFGFIIFASVQFSLLPLYARELLHLNASGYASLLGSFGAAAVFANLVFPRLRERYTPSQLIAYSSLATALNLIIMAVMVYAHSSVSESVMIWVVRASMIFGGTAWPIMMQTCNVTLVRSVPNWVRSRAAGMFSTVFMGGTTIGSAIWGGVAREHDIPTAFLGAAIGLVLGPLVLQRFVIVDPGNANLSPSLHWPQPEMQVEPEPEEGPVLVTVEYEIAPEDAEAFVAAMEPVRRLKLRNGALRSNLFQDTADPTRWVETVLVGSWNEHMRQHARITHLDREIEDAAHAYHRGPEPPKVSHLIASSARPTPEESDDDNDV